MYSIAAQYNLVVDANKMVIEIVDVFGTKSVTNDAERVIEEIVRTGIAVDDYVIIYRDTEGFWDGMKTEDSRFMDFVLMGATHASDAASAMRHHRTRRDT